MDATAADAGDAGPGRGDGKRLRAAGDATARPRRRHGGPYTVPVRLDPSERAVIASHILYSPYDDPSAATELPASDPAWGLAAAEARHAAAGLRTIADSVAREAAFAALARTESDDTDSGQQGGSLGTFTREVMVPEFGDPLFDAVDPQPGDIIGPVRSDFGWHVIMYMGEGDPANAGDY